MLLRDLDDVRRLFGSLKGTFIGVGVNAYSRIIPAYFQEPYHIIAFRKTRDLPQLRKGIDIFCLEEEIGHFVKHPGVNSLLLLSHPSTGRFLKGLPDPKYLLLYQSYPALEELAQREGWFLLANHSSLREQVSDRGFFLKMARSLQFNEIPGDIFPIQKIYTDDYADWAETISPEFVVQLPEISQGGGKGTFFVRSKEQYRTLRETLKVGRWRGIELKRVMIRRFIGGIPASLNLCLTKQGILFSRLQRQLIDLPHCRHIKEDGIFCGHSWSEASWPSGIEDEATLQARAIGEYLSGLGYRGILGIDFLISDDETKIYPIECNPRYTGAFPMLSQLHLCRDVPPMDVFHMLEFLDVPYDIDLEYLNAKYKETREGSHIILFSRPDRVLERKPAAPGLYEFDEDKGTIRFLEGASTYREIRNERQFIIIDGPPDAGEESLALRDPFYRLCRILFPYPVVNGTETLSPRAARVADLVFERMVL